MRNFMNKKFYHLPGSSTKPTEFLRILYGKQQLQRTPPEHKSSGRRPDIQQVTPNEH